MNASAIARLVDVFASWPDLRRAEKRQLLAAYRIRIALRTTRKKHPPEVDSVSIGLLSLDGVRVYK